MRPWSSCTAGPTSAVSAGLDTRHPLAASLCLRAMIEVLDMAQTSRSRAVRQLDSCRRLASSIRDWGRFPPHNAYVRELLRAYAQGLDAAR